MAVNDLYIAWLNDAYAMEKNIEEVLKRHADQAKEYPNIQSKIQQHLEVTRRHAELVKECIERNGESVSAVKSGTADIMGAMTGMVSGVPKDRLIKNAIAEFTTEHLEIASYVALIAAAEDLGDRQTATVCRQILAEEREMADWLEREMPAVSQLALRQEVG